MAGMPQPFEFAYDAATAISKGRRDSQEDAVAADFLAGSGSGFAVLADGMGGHAAGDIASKIVVTEIFSDLKLQAGDPEAMEGRIGEVLQQSAYSANACLKAYSGQRPQTRGMGATLLAPVLFQDRLYWISVGDSPLYLFRSGKLIRLNAEHSMAAELECRVANGTMARAAAASHPDRHCVTSVLTGGGIPRIDCRSAPVRLREGDIVLAASDGLQFLSEAEIAEVLDRERHSPGARIGAALMTRLEQLNAEDQDNACLCVIKLFAPQREDAVRDAAPEAAPQQTSGNGPRRRKTTMILASVSVRSGASGKKTDAPV